jgi:peptidoglycan/LPS O-acetylase OafA/YrhL
MTAPREATTPGRILGWDLLRGLCALAVAIYHLLMWQDVAQLHTFGAYGVYLFFVLSGASLAYTYSGPFREGQFSFSGFLWVRYMRLAPLYLVLMLAVLPWKLAKEGWGPPLATKLALNATFLFGFFDPAVNAVLIGGWSLGIEAIFYLVFPALLLCATHSRQLGLALFALLALLQAAWIAQTIGGPGGYAPNAVAYHQAPAFAAYFMGGCLLGLSRRKGRAPGAPAPGLLAAVGAGFVLLWALNTAEAGDELLGWRGLACAALCFALAWLAGGLDLRNVSARVAAHLGDATYGLYLIHPIVFFAANWFLIPRLGLPEPARWPLALQWMLLLAVIAVSMVLAVLSERYFERPLRDWSKRRRTRVRQSEASSISK